jgi:hypothetical protein
MILSAETLGKLRAYLAAHLDDLSLRTTIAIAACQACKQYTCIAQRTVGSIE